MLAIMPLYLQALILFAIPAVLWLAFYGLVVRILMTRTSLNPAFTFVELGEESLDAEERAHLERPSQQPGCVLIGMRKLTDFAPGSTGYLAMYRWDRERLAVGAMVMAPSVGQRMRLTEFFFTDHAGISWTINDSPMLLPNSYPWKRVLRYPQRPGFASVQAIARAIAGQVDLGIGREDVPPDLGFPWIARRIGEELGNLVQRGRYRAAADGRLVPTLFGAVCMAWRFTWPGKDLCQAAAQREAERILRQAGGA
jgi:hypothetical protein